MDTQIFLLNIKEQLQNPVDRYLKYFSDERVKKILSYRFNSDRNRTLWAELLARTIIADMTGKNFTEIKIFRDSDGRPYCSEPGIFFSLSHAGNFVACSAGDSQNGVDVEILDRRIDINIAKRFFLTSEYLTLKNLNEDEFRRKFFEYWTLKESCLKCLCLDEWSHVDCEKLLGGEYEKIQGKNFYISDAVIGICSEKNKMPKNFTLCSIDFILLKYLNEA